MEINNKEEGIKSPFTEVPPYDYNKYRDDTAVLAIKRFFEIMGENAGLLAFNSKAMPDEITENTTKVAQKIMEALVDNRVAECDMKYVFESIQVSIYQIGTVISKQKSEVEKELMARTIGARNPGDQHYSREYATLGDLFMSLEKVRKEQENDPFGYFYLKPNVKTDEPTS